MPIHANISYAGGSSDDIEFPTGDDSEVTVKVFGVILRDGIVPDMTQILGDGSEFTTQGDGRLINDISLHWDGSEDSPGGLDGR